MAKLLAPLKFLSGTRLNPPSFRGSSSVAYSAMLKAGNFGGHGKPSEISRIFVGLNCYIVKLLYCFVVSLFFSLLITNYYLLITTPLFAQETGSWKEVTVKLNGKTEKVAGFKDLETVFANILIVATALAGIACFVMLVVGGFRYLTSGGDPKANEAAKNTITWAVVGIFLLVAAWFILKMISEFTGLTGLLEFEIPTE